MSQHGISKLSTRVQLVSCCSVTMQSKTIYKKKDNILYKEIEPLCKDDAIVLEDIENLLSVHNGHLIKVINVHFKYNLDIPQ